MPDIGKEPERILWHNLPKDVKSDLHEFSKLKKV